MALSHLHLILNHVPIIGAVIALGLLLLAFARRSADLRSAGLEIFVVVGLITLPVFLSGVGAQREIAGLPDVATDVLRAHYDAALLGAILMLFTGIAAWVGLWQTRRLTRPAPAVLGAVVLLGFVTLALMGLVANLGGQIRHPEVTALQAVQVVQSPGWLTTASIADTANMRLGVWPAAEALHFIGMWLLFGILLVANLRLLGVMKQASFPALHGLLPWAMLGLTINFVTGMTFVIAMPGQYAGWPFYWKIALLMVAGFNLLYLTIANAPWKVGAGESAPVIAQAVAATGIVAWLAVMYFGRMLPFLGHAF